MRLVNVNSWTMHRPHQHADLLQYYAKGETQLIPDFLNAHGALLTADQGKYSIAASNKTNEAGFWSFNLPVYSLPQVPGGKQARVPLCRITLLPT